MTGTDANDHHRRNDSRSSRPPRLVPGRPAAAAGVTVRCVRWWEAKHGRRLHPVRSGGHGPQRIAKALHKAGVILLSDPSPGVRINPQTYEGDIPPPRYVRWERHRKSDSQRAQRECRTEFRLLCKMIPRP